MSLSFFPTFPLQNNIYNMMDHLCAILILLFSREFEIGKKIYILAMSDFVANNRVFGLHIFLIATDKSKNSKLNTSYLSSTRANTRVKTPLYNSNLYRKRIRQKNKKNLIHCVFLPVKTKEISYLRTRMSL